MSSMQKKLPPHVVIFPVPVVGHLNFILKLAQLFCLADLYVTFIISEFSHRRLINNTSLGATFASYPGFQFLILPDGLPDDHPRYGNKIKDLLPSVINTMVPLFKKMMTAEHFFASAGRRPVTCFVADVPLIFAADFAEENGIPLIFFRAPGASYCWPYFKLNDLIESQELPIGGKSMDELVKGIPAMEEFLRFRDLPSFFRTDDIHNPFLHSLADSTLQIVRAQAIIFNTSEDLEGPILSNLLTKIPRVYAVGPIHEHLKTRLIEKKAEASTVAGNLWAEDRSCIDWLNGQPSRSVIYVSFGSIAVVTREQLLEFWHGLVNSSQRFLWVMRPDSVAGNDGGDRISAELMKSSEGKGYFVEWAPQEEVLNHPAVGGFLTHSGWNSTLESIVAGVPMLCYPYFGDQTLHSRYVSDVWKIGLDIKDTCDRLIFEKAVRELMVERKDEFLERADEVAKLAKKAVSKGGSSYCDMDGLVEFIKSLIV